MLEISGYHFFSLIHAGQNSNVFRGIRTGDRLPVVGKLLKRNYPTPEEITRYRLEYQITQSLHLAGVVQAYDLLQYDNSLVMILEDFGGESIEKLMVHRQFSLVEILEIGISLADALQGIHQAHVIHKDINPANIVLNLATRQLKIIDFGISTALSRESLTFQHPRVLEGTLPYMSPEQTGRTNQVLDYRTDFYSLGVMLYQLLTGQLPFQCDDPLELVHHHLAVQPCFPQQIAGLIPTALAAIVLKLMAKAKDERYQSADGLKADLQVCQAELQAKGKVSPFVLGSQDVSEWLQISPKLYGRTAEIATLQVAFAQAHQGHGQIMLVSGYSGIGKSSLVQELYQPITQRRGYFIVGKFDQYQRNIPYLAIAQAFDALIRQLLMEDDVSLQQWRGRLEAALGANGQVMTDIMPLLERLIGPQPEVMDLPPTESQNRFSLVFQNLIGVFAQPAHPLVLFLDDLQWADAASLKLLQLVMGSTQRQALLLIGAYRDNEVGPTHPLQVMLEGLAQLVGQSVGQLVLKPLGLPDVNQLIADSLRCPPAQSLPLAKLVQQKTGGNPFFMNKFLQSLHSEGLLVFDAAHRVWQWSLPQIQARGMTDNVVELMTGEIQKLPAVAQQMLQVAACIGNTFALNLLAIATETSASTAAQVLHGAIANGLIVPLNNDYKAVELGVPLPSERAAVTYQFAHDRIQQAAYSLLSEAERPVLHYRLGHLLLDMMPADDHALLIFDVVNQLNLSQGLINDPDQRQQLAQLNLQAARRARDSAAYEPALTYLRTALALLPAHSWQTNYDATLTLYSLAAEAAYLNGQPEQMELWANEVLTQARTLLDKANVYAVKIQAYAGQMQFLKALQIALQALALLGVHFPEPLTADDVEQAFSDTAAQLAGHQIDDLVYLPAMTDPTAPAIMRLLADMLAPSYQAAPALFPLLILKMINLSLDYGNNALSAFAYSAYGNILCGIRLEIEAGYQFGQLAMSLLERFPHQVIRCRTLFMVNTCIRFRKIHLKETIQPLQTAYQLGLDQGDIEFAGYSILHHCDHCFFTGMALPDLNQKLADYIQALTQLNESTNASALKVYQQTVLNLMQPTAAPSQLRGDVCDEDRELAPLLQANHQKGLFYLYFNKLLLACLFRQFAQAVDYANQASHYLDGGRANAVFPIFYFYDSLVRLLVYRQSETEATPEVLAQVAANQDKMALWASHAPMNYLHKWQLVEAERYRLAGQDIEAMDAYDQAIALAKQHDYLQDEALANELAAEFYRSKGKTIITRAYLQEAHYGYSRWGAAAKVGQLERLYPKLVKHRLESLAEPGALINNSLSSQAEVLDLAAVIKASRAIAREIVLDRLLEKLMKILIQNAGAQTGYLLVATEGNLRLEVTGSVERDKRAVLQSMPLELLELDADPPFSLAIVNYVAHTQEPLVLSHAADEGQFRTDPWIVAHQAKSIVCVPLVDRGRLSGLVYLENHLATGVFTADRVELLNVLSGQAAIAIDNARLLKHQAELNASLQAEIAERQQAEKEREQMVAILAASTDHIGISDPEGRVLWNNAQARLILGLPADADVSDLQIADYHPQWVRQLLQTEGLPTACQDGIWVGETALLQADGSELPVSQMIIAHKSATGDVEFFSTIMRDISTIKVAEAKIRTLNLDLEQRVRQRTTELEATNKELESFSYSVSHDLRAPLRHIQGFANALQQRLEAGSGADDPKVQHYLQVIVASGQKMGLLIDGLLQLSRIGRQQILLHPVDLQQIVTDAVSMVNSARQADQGSPIVWQIDKLPTIVGDPTLLQQVFANLLGNAVKFSRDRSPIRIAIGALPDDTIFVRDNGVGFAVRYADKMFQPFQRLHGQREFEGTGIGLAIVQRIIHRHGGTIWAESQPDQGASFYFKLPVA